MTDQLSDVSARIESIRQLGAVVNAMKGIAAARAHAARMQVDAVDHYAQTISDAMASVLRPDAPAPAPAPPVAGKQGLLIFLAEQGFVGAFSEHVLESLPADPGATSLFLVGSRGIMIAGARGLKPVWSAPMPSHTASIPHLADQITTAVYKNLAQGRIDRLDAVRAHWQAGRPEVKRHPLFPISWPDAGPRSAPPPLTQLALDPLLTSLGADYLHAQICKAALHAFAAENEARMESMTATSSQISRELAQQQATLRRVRQEAITAEIIELGTAAR